MIDLSQLEKVKTEFDYQIEAKKAETIGYLVSTDWYVIRSIETGEAVPTEISEKRNESRLFLKSL